MGESAKARSRREKEGWFAKYITYPGIDIGCGDDPVDEKFDKWDRILGHGDATLMRGIEDEAYATVYASHIIEHLYDPLTGLKNWFRILKPGGNLIILAPHRDLYEKRRTLPSRWNGDHKTFWLPETYEPPCTFSLKHTVWQALGENFSWEYRILDEGWKDLGEREHSVGEYSIEFIIKK